MKTKRLPFFLLAMLLFLSGCAGTPQNAGEAETASGQIGVSVPEEGGEPEPEPELTDAVPDTLDFGGADFIFLANSMYGAPSLVEGTNGEVLNDATYEVELYAEDRLNVNISEVLDGAMLTTAPQLVASGDTSYDTYSMSDKEATTVAMQGVFHPMSEIPYVNLTQIYWGDGLSDSLSIGGANFFAVSSFNLYSLERTVVLLFNETVAKNHQIEIPFEAVFNGTWTQDMLASYGNIATEDLNGDGVMDLDDSFTYGSVDYRDTPEKFIFASGMNMVDIGEDDLPYLTLYGNEKFIDSLEWTRQVFFGDNSCPKAPDVGCTDLFVSDREMITVAEFRYMPTFREMESDFSMLPTPKYDEAQQRYYSRTCNVIFSMVPVTAQDLDKSGAVQEVMCCAGYKTMLPAYIDSAMKNKVARNQESADAIQIIYDTRTLDLAKLYLPSFFDTKMYTVLRAGKGVVSTFEKQRSRIEEALQNVIDSLTNR